MHLVVCCAGEREELITFLMNLHVMCFVLFINIKYIINTKLMLFKRVNWVVFLNECIQKYHYSIRHRLDDLYFSV